MGQRLRLTALLVREYDEAIAYFTQILGFRLVEDTPLSEVKRWVVVEPAGTRHGGQLLLARAVGAEQVGQVGRQAGGRVAFFLETDDFDFDFGAMKARGVHFAEEPRSESYGMVAVFEDLYGNRWDLIEMPSETRS